MNGHTTESGQLVGITHTEHEGVLVTTITGEIDLSTVEVIDTELATRLRQQPTAVVVDLDAVDFFGSLGITALLQARQHAERRGVGFAVVANRRQARRALEVTDTLQPLGVRRTLAEAVELARSTA
ncbi:STAS domain-containing protein [Actinosynnema sp. CA-299493]